jgi:hypothetical protein
LFTRQQAELQGCYQDHAKTYNENNNEEKVPGTTFLTVEMSPHHFVLAVHPPHYAKFLPPFSPSISPLKVTVKGGLAKVDYSRKTYCNVVGCDKCGSDGTSCAKCATGWRSSADNKCGKCALS